MTISEVSKKYDVSPDTLRYYERIGLIPPVRKNKSGIRNYNEIDLKWIEFIKCMKSAGITVEYLVKYVQLFQQGDKTIGARKEILQKQREETVARMAELQKTLDMLDYKIKIYDNCVVQMEQELMQIEDLI